MKVQNPIDRRIFDRVRRRAGGAVFAPADFFDLGSRHAVDKALSRMAVTGRIRRVGRGLYDLPRQHPVLGVLSPASDSIARALATKSAIRLQPTGAYAANLLGLSDQVPARIQFLTDGRSRSVKVGKQTISLKRTTPRNMATAGRLSGLIIQALRYLGKTNAAGYTARLKQRLADTNTKPLLKDLAHAPAWIAKIMRQLAEKS